MAASWLFLALRVDNVDSTKLAELICPPAMVGALYGRRTMIKIADLIGACAGGLRTANAYAVVMDDAGTRSTGNIACVRANAAGNTITITYGAQTVVLTEGATGESGFARGASDTTCAANLATCINAHSILGPLITALGAVGDCGLTSKVTTNILQDIAMTTDDGTAFSFTQLTGGTEGAAKFFPQQLKLQRTAT